jgi:hypothetical protein
MLELSSWSRGLRVGLYTLDRMLSGRGEHGSTPSGRIVKCPIREEPGWRFEPSGIGEWAT